MGVVLLMLLLAAAPDQKADLKAIEELHKRDIAANKAYDIETLTSLWTDDVVTMPPATPPIVGKKANHDMLVAAEPMAKLVDILDYKQDWKELQILGEYAYEWGIFSSVVKGKQGSPEPLKSEFRVMRILKRQPDGSWKVHRSIWNSAPPPETPQPKAEDFKTPVILPPPKRP